MTLVVNGNRQPFDVYIGRPSIWGNPFYLRNESHRAEAVAQYSRWVVRQPKLLAQVHTLRGKTLGCHCAPKLCHGHVLALLADGLPPDCLDLFI